MLAAFTALVLIAGLATPLTAAPSAHAESAVPGTLLVTTTSGEATAALSTGASEVFAGATSQRLAERVAKVTVTPGREAAAASALERLPGVVAVERDNVYSFSAVPDDPAFDEQWAHGLIGSAGAWDLATGSRQVTVAVLDSGVDGRHPDLLPNLAAQVDVSTGVVRERQRGSDNATCLQDGASEHGTWVAGVIGAVGNNATGVAGVNWEVSMRDVALTSAQSICAPTDSAIITGLAWVRDQAVPVDVVNLSVGGAAEACPAALQTALDEVRALGTVVVAAAGNSGQSVPHVPASCDGVLSVGAVGPSGTAAGYSTSNPYVDLAAPGGSAAGCDSDTCVLTTARGDAYQAVAGTSLASPYVAGVAALMRSVWPGLHPDKIESVLERTARHPEGPGVRDDIYGFGVLDADAALARALSGETIPDAEANPTFPVAGQGSGGVLRIRHGGGVTEPVTQAVATSRTTFGDGGAAHVVLARSDDFADALAGSSLGYGIGPLLFTPPSGSLAGATRFEIERVLPRGGTVYLLGGSDALDPRLDGQLRDLGFEPRRLFGRVREGTAAAVAQEVAALRDRLGRTPPPAAILATRGDWPDAVTAGSLGAIYGLPVLLTQPDALHPETAAALARLAPETLYVIGGTGVLTDETADAAARAAGAAAAPRLFGKTRDGTAVAVATEVQRLLADQGRRPAYGVVVNLDRPDGFAHVLSASSLVATTRSLFIGVRGLDGELVPPSTVDYACNLAVRPLLVGDVDVVPTATRDQVVALIDGDC